VGTTSDEPGSMARAPEAEPVALSGDDPPTEPTPLVPPEGADGPAVADASGVGAEPDQRQAAGPPEEPGLTEEPGPTEEPGSPEDPELATAPEGRQARRAGRRQRRRLSIGCVLLITACVVITVLIVGLARNRAPAPQVVLGGSVWSSAPTATRPAPLSSISFRSVTVSLDSGAPAHSGGKP
jgi:hypothetical protein